MVQKKTVEKKKEMTKKSAKKEEEKKADEEKRKRYLEELERLMAQDNTTGYTNAKYVLTNVPTPQGTGTIYDEDSQRTDPVSDDQEGREANAGSAIIQDKNPEEETLHYEDISAESIMLLGFYIQEMKKDGVPKELLKRKLERTGWPGTVIDRFL